MTQSAGKGIWRQAAPAATITSLSAAIAWYGHANLLGLAAATLASFVGVWIGFRFSATRLRSGVVPIACLLSALLGMALLQFVSRWQLITSGDWPERIAGGIDAARVGLLSASAATLLGYLAARIAWARLLPTAALTVSAVLRLMPHRGGAIHRPHAIADPAFLRGINPALLLAACGVAAACVAAWGLYRAGRGRWLVVQIGVLALLAWVVFLVAPHLDLISFPTEDPLRLTRGPDKERSGNDQRADRKRQSSKEGRDPLGLGDSGEALPFKDDYDDGGASKNNPPVAVVSLRDEIGPRDGVFYFRQVAFSKWNGRRLVGSLDPRVDSDLFVQFPIVDPLSAPPVPGADHRQEVPSVVALLRDHGAPLALSDAQTLSVAENPDPSLFRRIYQVDSWVATLSDELLMQHRAGSSAWPETVRRDYLETPDDPRYRSLADQIVLQLKPQYRSSPFARALAVRYWLTVNTKYSKRSKHAAASDPTADFLFGDRIGYCVHLAHAAALLMRELGVPSRVSGGYAYTAADRGGGSTIMLRAGDAHAWAEGYFEDVGWIQFDPSPESLDPPAPAPDPDLQRLLGELARPSLLPHEKRAASDSAWPGSRVLLKLLAGVLLALLAAGYFTKLWRRWAPRFGREPRGRLAYRAALDRLAELGWTRRRGESRESFAERAAPISRSFQQLTALHLAANFGRDAALPSTALRLSDAVRHDLSAQRFGRRLAAGLNPFAWLRSR